MLDSFIFRSLSGLERFITPRRLDEDRSFSPPWERVGSLQESLDPRSKGVGGIPEGAVLLGDRQRKERRQM